PEAGAHGRRLFVALTVASLRDMLASPPRRCMRQPGRQRQESFQMNDPHAGAAGNTGTVSARISPVGGLDVLSRNEVVKLRGASDSGLHALLRRCALAVLTSGSISDDPRAILEQYPDFDIQVLQQDRGIKIELTKAPAQAFVDGQI